MSDLGLTKKEWEQIYMYATPPKIQQNDYGKGKVWSIPIAWEYNAISSHAMGTTYIFSHDFCMLSLLIWPFVFSLLSLKLLDVPLRRKFHYSMMN